MNDLFDEKNIPESNWAKFDEVGKTYSGKLVEVKDKEGEGDFPDQRVYVLEQEDGSFINVGISVNRRYVIDRANTAKMGDMLGFKYEKDIEPKTKGYNPAKSIQVYVKHTEDSMDL